MKNITIAGRLTKDAEQRTTPGGDKVTGFSVAVDDRSVKDASTIFFECNLWGARGDKLAQYLTKGSSVTVTGDLTRREYDGKTCLGVRVDNLTLQGGKAEAKGGGASNDTSHIGGGTRKESYDLNDDIPFVRQAFSYEC